MEAFTGPNSGQKTFLCHSTDFRNGECRPRIGLFTPFKLDYLHLLKSRPKFHPSRHIKNIKPQKKQNYWVIPRCMYVHLVYLFLDKN